MQWLHSPGQAASEITAGKVGKPEVTGSTREYEGRKLVLHGSSEMFQDGEGGELHALLPRKGAHLYDPICVTEGNRKNDRTQESFHRGERAGGWAGRGQERESAGLAMLCAGLGICFLAVLFLKFMEQIS